MRITQTETERDEKTPLARLEKNKKTLSTYSLQPGVAKCRRRYVKTTNIQNRTLLYVKTDIQSLFKAKKTYIS